MPRKISNAIPWANSDARKVLLGDIERNVFPDDIPVLKAWESIYSKMEAFKDVPYLQFVERVDAHQKQVQKRKDKSVDDLARLMHTRLTLAPPKTFLGSDTHKLLRKDVQKEMESGASPAPTKVFQARRPEYQALTTTFFGQRLRQERKTRKFYNHLEEKRAKIYATIPLLMASASHWTTLSRRSTTRRTEREATRGAQRRRKALRELMIIGKLGLHLIF